MRDRHFLAALAHSSSAATAFACVLALCAVCWPEIGDAQVLALHLQGNRLVDTNGSVVRLLGVSYDGSEYACIGGGNGNGNGYSVFQGPNETDPTFIAKLKAWHINTIRVPLNEDCWLGINSAGGSQYGGTAYQTAIENFVAGFNNAGFYIVLDLHWAAPGTNLAHGQIPMADNDNSLTFWGSVATAFKNTPGVVFDLFNEPYIQLGDESSNGTFTVGTTADWSCWLSGCSIAAGSQPGNPSVTWPTYQAAGMQQMLTAVRNAGATQPVILGGLFYAQDLTQWTSYLPTDTLNPPQFIAGIHPYCGPPGTGTAACQSDIPGIESTEWSDAQTIANSYPVVAGEFGEYDCATTYVYQFMDFADANGISYIGWSFNPEDSCGSQPALVSGSYDSPTPTAYGVGLYDHLAALNRLHATHDFNNDRTSDILWRDTSGDLAMWQMSAGQFSSGAAIAQVPTNWSVVGSRDFTGTGDADILWLDGSGDVALWLMNGTALGSGINLGNVGTQWTVAGTGDFNGEDTADGIADILWRNTTTGDLAIWLMNSSGQLSSGVDLGAVPLAWQVAGAGDFNNDGTTDILWRNTTTGDLAIWLMNSSGQMAAGFDLGQVPLTWTVVGTGDFNGDGVSDILWRDAAGDLAIWQMTYTNNSNNVTVQVQMGSGAQFAGIPTTWTVAGTGDFDGNGTADILWLDQSGDLAVWLMNGLTVSSYNGLGNVGTTWQVQGQNAD